ncbi:hypothetical protein KDN24_06850 [Bacillus sp. Bva_UNVM-123]|uniref:hypothetical protein n=1 Tax=Bacillus sp. Bva_UNVM-123 TaxID=2829798 RepID=UPI00391F3900
MYRFRMPIGDWSDDGHGKCNYYYIKSNKPVEEIREIHFKIKENTDVDIEKICRKFEESSIDVELFDALVGMGLDKENFDLPYKNKVTFSPKDMCNLWVFLLKKTDETLELEIEEEPKMLPFYGFDEKRRHIGFVGYGCFH